MRGIVPVPKRNRYEIKIVSPVDGKRKYRGMAKNLDVAIAKRDKLLK